jgi:hypothetical protein
MAQVSRLQKRLYAVDNEDCGRVIWTSQSYWLPLFDEEDATGE